MLAPFPAQGVCVARGRTVVKALEQYGESLFLKQNVGKEVRSLHTWAGNTGLIKEQRPGTDTHLLKLLKGKNITGFKSCGLFTNLNLIVTFQS